MVVHPPGVRQRAGGVDSAGQHIAHSPQAGLAHGAHPQGSVNAVSRIVDEAHGDGIGAVDDDGDGGDVAVRLHLSQTHQGVALVLVQGQVIRRQILVFTGPGAFDGLVHVVAFTANAADDVHNMLAVAQGHVAVIVLGFALDLGPLGFSHIGGGALVSFGVEGQQGLVDQLVANAGQHVHEVGGVGSVHSAGAGTAVDRIQGGQAHQGNLVAGGQGQGVGSVLQQNDTFALHLANQRIAGSLQLLNGGIHALVVALVALVFGAFLHHDLGGGGLEELMHLAGVGRSDGVAGVDDHTQHGHDIQEHFFERSLHYSMFSFPYGRIRG